MLPLYSSLLYCIREQVPTGVFKCSARSGDGKSLNDKSLLGPNLACNVVGVLICFRQHPVEVMADIKGMFF